MSSAQRQIFIIARVLDIMQVDNMLQKCFNCSYRGSRSLTTRVIESSTHCAFTCSKSAIETLEQGVKSALHDICISFENQQIYYFINLYFFVACVGQPKSVLTRYLGALLDFQNYEFY